MKTVTATVVKHTGSHYLLTVLPEWSPFPAVVRGKVRLLRSKATNPIAVGDRVVCEVPELFSASGLYGGGLSEGEAGEGLSRDFDGVAPEGGSAGGGLSEGMAPEGGVAGTGLSEGSAGWPSEQNPAVITEVLPRENYVIRRSTNLSREAHIIAANVDRAFIVVSLAFPEVKLPFLDRLLVTCEVYGIPATIVLNKIDLLREADPSGEFLQAFTDIYSRAGYPIILTSATTGEGIEELRAAMSEGGLQTLQGSLGMCNEQTLPPSADKREGPKACLGRGRAERGVCDSTSPDFPAAPDNNPGINLLSGESGVSAGVNLLSGVSGVGKSSLITALDPALKPRIGEISLAHLQGRHTTTFYEMYPLSSGGYVIDTPGIRSFGLLDLSPEEIALYFPEMLRASQGLPAISGGPGKTSSGCRFTPCTHTHEPGCAVKAAVDRGEISPERYNSYLGMLEEHSKYREAH